MTKAFELFKESLEKISDEDFAKILDEMENKELKIQVPEGYEIDKEKSTFEKIVFKKVKKELPKSWRELNNVNGYYVDKNSKIYNCINFSTDYGNRNIFPTEEEAEACIALAQLCQLRDRYNDGWKPDWEDDNQFKWNIHVFKDDIYTMANLFVKKVLVFKTEELRDKFLENFRDLIETAKPLL